MSIRKVFPEKQVQKLFKNPKKKIIAISSNSESPKLSDFNTPHKLLSPIISTKSRNIRVSPVKSLVSQCNEIKERLLKYREALLKDIQDTLEEPHLSKFDKIFHNSSNYIQRKQNIKENVKQHKCKYSLKLEKLKSIVDIGSKDYIGKEFISNDDVLNGEAMDFLNINKRGFGEFHNELLVFKDKKKKPLSDVQMATPTKLNGRNSSLPELKSPKLTPTMRNQYLLTTERKSLDRNINTPVSKYIMTEMKKLWPPDTEIINEKKRKILPDSP